MDDNCGEWVESMGVASGCGCMEVYKFPHLLIPTPLVYICSFLQQHPYFLFIFVNVFRSCSGTFCNEIVCIPFFAQYKHMYGQLRASHSSHMKGCT